MASYTAARDAVTKISEKYGHLDDKELEELGRINPKLRRKVERSLLAKDKIAGHAIITYGLSDLSCFNLLTLHR